MTKNGSIDLVEPRVRRAHSRDCYLALSEAGFATGLVQDQQIVFEKRRGVA